MTTKHRILTTTFALLAVFVLIFMLPIDVFRPTIIFFLVGCVGFLCLAAALGLIFVRAATTWWRWLLSLAVVAVVAWFAGYGSACLTATEEERGRSNSPFVHEVLAAPGLPGVLLGGPSYDLRIGEIRLFRYSAGTANAVFWLLVIPVSAAITRAVFHLNR